MGLVAGDGGKGLVDRQDLAVGIGDNDALGGVSKMCL
jgi:hypothetical protein